MKNIPEDVCFIRRHRDDSRMENVFSLAGIKMVGQPFSEA
jgi:hypothetical protein